MIWDRRISISPKGLEVVGPCDDLGPVHWWTSIAVSLDISISRYDIIPSQ